MRLLNSKTLEYQTFQHFRPPYAILSHTWGDEEITFNDLGSRNAAIEAKKGFRKIRDCSKQAVRDGYEWVWIDTVCIDKTSSAELSEAINSMFEWYQQSAVCYVYLQDVDFSFRSYTWTFVREYQNKFRWSRWFKRGWTLQELIAPRYVEFYSARWDELGTKRSLEALLADITGVRREILQGSPLSICSAAEKMSWSSSRETTRIEDAAYSLLGLFNVNMPLLYGEGQNAFQRLQLEILRQTEDYSLLAWPGHALDQMSENSGILAKSSSSFCKKVTETSFKSYTGRELLIEAQLNVMDAPTDVPWSSILNLHPSNEASMLNLLPTNEVTDKVPRALNQLGFGQVKKMGRQQGADIEALFSQISDPAAITNRGLRLKVLAMSLKDGVLLVWTFCVHAGGYICIFLQEERLLNHVSTIRNPRCGLALISQDQLKNFQPHELFVRAGSVTPSTTAEALRPIRPPLLLSYDGQDNGTIEGSVLRVVDQFPSGSVWVDDTIPEVALLAIYHLKCAPEDNRLLLFVGKLNEKLWCAIHLDPEGLSSGETSLSLYPRYKTLAAELAANTTDRASVVLSNGNTIHVRIKDSFREHRGSVTVEVLLSQHIKTET
jgi:Heterokaryon incompatibility protein (HET)